LPKISLSQLIKNSIFFEKDGIYNFLEKKIFRFE